MNYLIIFALILLAYIIGAIPTGYIAGKLKGINIREHGSGNIGATNSLRVLGTIWGFIVLFIDMGKAFAAVIFIAPLMSNYLTLDIHFIFVLTGIFVILGNIFNPFFKFKGGKGVAASAGVLLSLNYVVFLIGLALFLIIVIISKMVSLGSLIGVISIFTLSFFINYNIYYTVFFGLLTIFIIIKHKQNIARIIKGNENKIQFTKKGINK